MGKLSKLTTKGKICGKIKVLSWGNIAYVPLGPPPNSATDLRHEPNFLEFEFLLFSLRKIVVFYSFI